MARQSIETERLRLRRWKPDDVAPYAAICADPEVMRWIGNGKTRCAGQCAEQCAEALASFDQDWQEHGFGLFAAELRQSNRFVGFIGLAIPEFLPDVLPAVEIGWRLSKDIWGRGLATEGARATLRFGLEDRRLERILSIHQIGNSTSGRIMEKLGMLFERETIDRTCDRPVRVYEIFRSDRGNVGSGKSRTLAQRRGIRSGKVRPGFAVAWHGGIAHPSRRSLRDFDDRPTAATGHEMTQ